MPVFAHKTAATRDGMSRDELYDAKACEVESERHQDLGGVCGMSDSVVHANESDYP